MEKQVLLPWERYIQLTKNKTQTEKQSVSLKAPSASSDDLAAIYNQPTNENPPHSSDDQHAASTVDNSVELPSPLLNLPEAPCTQPATELIHDLQTVSPTSAIPALDIPYPHSSMITDTPKSTNILKSSKQFKTRPVKKVKKKQKWIYIQSYVY